MQTVLYPVLANSSSTYFANRFNGRFNASGASVDARGRSVYFIDRPPTRFEYVRDYTVTLNLHIPENDITLRQSLREEAEYFGMEGMSALLKVSHREVPNLDNQGILYWLGTREHADGTPIITIRMLLGRYTCRWVN